MGAFCCSRRPPFAGMRWYPQLCVVFPNTLLSAKPIFLPRAPVMNARRMRAVPVGRFSKWVPWLAAIGASWLANGGGQVVEPYFFGDFRRFTLQSWGLMDQNKSINGTAGLCATCIHAETIHSNQGSIFYRCLLSAQDLRFPKYPRLPVLTCPGHAGSIRTPEDRNLVWTTPSIRQRLGAVTGLTYSSPATCAKSTCDCNFAHFNRTRSSHTLPEGKGTYMDPARFARLCWRHSWKRLRAYIRPRSWGSSPSGPDGICAFPP